MERPYEIVETDTGPVYRVRVRGTQVMREPHIFRGTAFDLEERAALGLVGLLPQGVSTIDGQTKRVHAQYLRSRDDLAKNVYLTALRDRNEVLFYRLLSEHIDEMLPIIYTPTIGQAIQRYSHEYRRPRGVFLSIDHQDLIEESLRNFGRSPDEVDLIVATASEGILGIGDQGVGGIEIAIGKLTVYIAAAGIHPQRVIPVVLDVGTTTTPCSPTPCTWAIGTPVCAGSSTTSSSMPTCERRTTCSRAPCCTGRTSGSTTPGASWTGTRTRSARSTTTCRAPPPWPWPRSRRVFGLPARGCATSAWLSWARGRPVWVSPTSSRRPWSATASPGRTPSDASGWWDAADCSPRTWAASCSTSSGPTHGRPTRWPRGDLRTGRRTWQPRWRGCIRRPSSARPRRPAPSPRRSSERWPGTSTAPSSSRSPTPRPGSRPCRPTCSPGPMGGRWWRPAVRSRRSSTTG